MRHEKNYPWGRDELIEAMTESYARLEKELGRPPKGGEVVDDLGTTWATITKLVGGWSNFLILLGKWDGTGALPIKKRNKPIVIRRVKR